MFRPAPLFIGLRYTRAKRRSRFVSFISLASMLGIALGVMVLITVLSVMNGFDDEIQNRIFNLAPQITIRGETGAITNWQPLAEQLAHFHDVTMVAPYVSGQGLLAGSGTAQAVFITGVDPDQKGLVAEISKHMLKGSFSMLKRGEFNIIIGQALAENLGVLVGDKVNLIIPEATPTPIAVIPRFKRFTVTGIFHVEGNWGYDSSVAFIHIRDAQQLYQLGDDVTGLQLNVTSLFAAPAIAADIQKQLSPGLIVGDWTQQYGALFKAIRMEKTMMFIILLLIIAIAAFNLVVTLVMVVNDKRAEIAILRTLGATPRMVMMTFIVQGLVVGFIGTLLGVLAGIVLALNVTAFEAWIERVFHVELISASVYFISYLPSKLVWADVWHISLAALLMSLAATIYPSWSAARTQPAQALRYE